VVADFLIGMQRLDAEADALVPHAIGLLESALGWASGAGPTNGALTRERVHGFIRRHATDPRLDSESVAAGCGVSRRTLYRALAEAGEPLSALIRRLRVIHARRQSRKWHRSSARLTQIVAMSPYPDGCAAYPC
jgi:AraC-like DNA-binding protein